MRTQLTQKATHNKSLKLSPSVQCFNEQEWLRKYPIHTTEHFASLIIGEFKYISKDMRRNTFQSWLQNCLTGHSLLGNRPYVYQHVSPRGRDKYMLVLVISGSGTKRDLVRLFFSLVCGFQIVYSKYILFQNLKKESFWKLFIPFPL